MVVVGQFLWYNRNKTLQNALLSENNPVQGGNCNFVSCQQHYTIPPLIIYLIVA